MRSGLALAMALAIIVCCHSAGLAQPAVSGLEGALGRGSQITIYGSAFGTKAQAAPLAWDDFQSGVPGEYLVDRHDDSRGVFDLQYYECRWPVYSIDFQRFAGDVCALQEFDGSRGPPEWPSGCGTNRAMGIIDEPSTVWYVSYWCYQDDYAGTALSSTNVKITPWFFQSSWTHHYQFHWQEFWYSPSGSYIAASDCTGGPVFQYGGVYRDGRGKWTRVESFLDIGSVGQPDGYMAAYKDLELLRQHQGAFRPAGCENALVGSFHMGNNFFNDGGAVLNQYLSELYVDHSFARVEIGNSPNWSTCTTREIQIPVAWTPTSITVTGNPGTFQPGNLAYLFIVDQNRQHSVGYPVVIGHNYQQGDQGAPGVPGTVSFSTD